MVAPKFDETNKLWTSVDAPPLFNPNASLGQIIFHALKSHGTRVAQVSVNSGLTLRYDEILSKSIRVALNLRARGYQKGQLFTIISPNTHHVASVVFGCLYLGCSISAIDETFDKSEIKHMMSITKPALVFCDISFYDKVRDSLDKLGRKVEIFTFGGQGSEAVEELMVECGDETRFLPSYVDGINDVAMITCSSGTTGFPKAICHSHAVLADNITRLSMYKSDDVIFNVCTLHWIAGVRFLLHSTMVGAKRLITSEQSSPELYLRTIEKFKVTCILISAGDTLEIYHSDLLKTTDLSSVKHYFVGASSVPQNVVEHLNMRLSNGDVHILYGLSETSGTITADFPKSYANGSVGRFRGGIWAKIVDENGDRCGVGINGELCVKGPHKFLGYYGNQAETDELFDKEGFLLTGDIGHVDSDGLFYIVARKKDVILYMGFFVYPSIVENHLLKSSLIHSVCVVGVPHENDGELVAAAIIPSSETGLTEAMVHRMVDELSDDFYQLRGGVYFMKSMPTTTTGKIIRKEVKRIVYHLYNNTKFPL